MKSEETQHNLATGKIMHQTKAVVVYNSAPYVYMVAPPESEMVVLYQQLREFGIANSKV